MGVGYFYLRWGNPVAWAQIYWERYRLARRKRRFGVIEGRKNDKPTLH
jgi:hypothetical protein